MISSERIPDHHRPTLPPRPILSVLVILNYWRSHILSSHFYPYSHLCQDKILEDRDYLICHSIPRTYARVWLGSYWLRHSTAKSYILEVYSAHDNLWAELESKLKASHAVTGTQCTCTHSGKAYCIEQNLGNPRTNKLDSRQELWKGVTKTKRKLQGRISRRRKQWPTPPR